MSNSTVQRKKFTIELKENGGEEGTFSAVFSRFNEIDHDGDVTLPGAFTKGQKVPIAGVGHNWDTPTIGYGIVDYDDEKAWIDGKFNLKMASGREHYESVKFAHENGVNQEYSYAYGVKQKGDARALAQWPGAKRVLGQLEMTEVSPVMLGAGIGTGTMAIKARQISNSSKEKLPWPTMDNAICPECGITMIQHTAANLDMHRTQYESKASRKESYPWDQCMSDQKAKGLNDDSAERICGWIKGHKERKQAALSDEDKRCILQDAITLQSQIEDVSNGEDPSYFGPWIVATYDSYVIVRDDDDDGYMKISYTLTDKNEIKLGEAVAVEQIWAEKSAELAATKYAVHGERTLAVLSGFVDRSKSLVEIRAKVGRQLSAANRDRLTQIAEAAHAATRSLRALLSETEPEEEISGGEGTSAPPKGKRSRHSIESALSAMRARGYSHGKPKEKELEKVG